MKKTAMTLACLFLVLLLLPLFGSPAQAYSNDTWEWEIQYGEATVTKYKGSDAEVTIPNTIGTGYQVTKIGNRTFEDNKTLEKVYIPSTVTSIGQSAFSGCSNLQTINGASGVDYIDKFAFAYCSSLESWAIPSGVEVINDYVFFQCTGLRELTIPDSVTQIKYYAFNGCDSLATIYFGGEYNAWVLIDIYNENGVNDDLVNATIIYSVPPIIATGVCGAQGDNLDWTLEQDAVYLLRITGTGNMADFSEATSPWFPWSYPDEAVNSIGDVSIASGVTSIGAYAFYLCKNLTNLSIPSSVKRIGENAFCYCKSLQGITIPSGVTNIADYTFAECRQLVDIILPSTITNIGDYAFLDCYALGVAPIPSSVKSIGAYAFAYCTSLSSAVIPSGVTTIAEATFIGCSYMDEVTIPVNVTSIGDSAFYDCNSLTDVYFGGTEAQWETLLTHTDTYNEPLLNATVHCAPTITGQPQSISAPLGGSAKFVVTAKGEGSISYQWQYQKPGESTWNNVQVNGTSATFNQTNVAARHNGYKFRCKVTNALGTTTSNAATLTVAVAPAITSQPSSVTATLGSTATFKVVASGSGLTYQWQYQKPGESTWNNVQVNGTSATFNQTNVASRHNGYKFRCKVTNSGGSVTSSIATLTLD